MNSVEMRFVESATMESGDSGNATRQIIIDLCGALHTFGVAAHELEESMAETCRVLGVSAGFFATPTSVFITFGEAGEHRTSLLRVTPGEVNLDKLCALYRVQEQLIDGNLSVDHAIARVRQIVTERPRYGWSWILPANAIAAGTAATFFGGGWDEAGIAGALGLVVGCLAWVTSRHGTTRNLLTPAASLVVSMAAFGLSPLMSNTAAEIVTVSSLILLIPGLGVTVAMNELATQNLASGSARFIGAMSQLMLLGFGVALGQSLIALFVDPVRNSPGDALPLPLIVASLLLASTAFTVLFQARPSHWPLIVMAGFLAFFGAKAGVRILGPFAGPSLAAVCLGVMSNIIARVRHRPASVTLVPGLLLLVPGSIGFRSITNLLNEEPVRSFESAFTMILVAASIASGLLLANVLAPQSLLRRRPNVARRSA